MLCHRVYLKAHWIQRCFGGRTRQNCYSACRSQRSPLRKTSSLKVQTAFLAGARAHRRFSTGPFIPEHPTVDPQGKPFDLGPFAFHRVAEDAEPMRLDRWVMKHVCSNWNATQKLLSSKQVWVLSADESTDQHRRSIMMQRFRPDCQGSLRLAPRDYVYYPKVMRPRPKRRAVTSQFGGEQNVDLGVAGDPSNTDWLLRRLLYKDSDFLAIDKPAGWSVGPGRHVGGAHLQRFLPSLRFGLEDTPRFVHRLGTDISGVLLLARHAAAAEYAKDVIRQRAFWQRSFWAAVCGRVGASGTVSMPLGQERHGQRMVARPRREHDGGLPAITEYKALRFSPLAGGVSLLEMNPYSGRHHQVRAHCAYGLHAPIIGDPVYYDLSNKMNVDTTCRLRHHSEQSQRERAQTLGAQRELHLHSRQMTLRTFAGKVVAVTAPVPRHMRESFRALGWAQFLREHDRQSRALNPWNVAEDPHVQEALEASRMASELHEARRAEAAATQASEEFTEPTTAEEDSYRYTWPEDGWPGANAAEDDTEDASDAEAWDSGSSGRRSSGRRRRLRDQDDG